jgi:hypothetical protein
VYDSEIVAVNAKISTYTTLKDEAELAVSKCTEMLGSMASDTPQDFLTKLGDGTFDVSSSGQTYSNTLAWLRRFDIDPSLLQADPVTVTYFDPFAFFDRTQTVSPNFSLATLGLDPTSRSYVKPMLENGYESTHFGATNINDWRSGTNGFTAAYQGSSVSYQDSQFALNNTPVNSVGATGRADIKSLLNTLISNKIRDGDMAQSKLQALTAQIQNNIEAMSALIKVFSESTKTLAQALR